MVPLGTSAPETITTTSPFAPAAGQRGFFTDAVEVVGGGDFFDHLRDNALAQHQLMRGGLVGGQRRDHRVREVFTHGFR